MFFQLFAHSFCAKVGTVDFFPEGISNNSGGFKKKNSFCSVIYPNDFELKNVFLFWFENSYKLLIFSSACISTVPQKYKRLLTQIYRNWQSFPSTFNLWWKLNLCSTISQFIGVFDCKKEPIVPNGKLVISIIWAQTYFLWILSRILLIYWGSISNIWKVFVLWLYLNLLPIVNLEVSKKKTIYYKMLR